MAPQMLAGEQPIMTARQHWLVLVPAVGGAALAVILGFVVVAFIPDTVSGHHVGGFRALLQLVVVVMAGVSAVGAWLRWRYRSYLLTDHRILCSRGVVARVTESIALDRVQDTRVRQTLTARMVHCGDVEIESAGREGNELLNFIPEPQLFANSLISAIEAHRLAQPYPGFAAGDPVSTGRSQRPFPVRTAPLSAPPPVPQAPYPDYQEPPDVIGSGQGAPPPSTPYPGYQPPPDVPGYSSGGGRLPRRPPPRDDRGGV